MPARPNGPVSSNVRPQPKNSMPSYDRNAEIQTRLNDFLVGAFDLPVKDYYGSMDLAKLLGLKSVLSDINNALTLQLTLSFVNWISSVLSIPPLLSKNLIDDVLDTKPSANGYDVHMRHGTPFVAEVKCNIPINGGTKYGAAQKSGIISDIESLINGKTKAAQISEQTLKFMVFLDLPEVRAANEHLRHSNSKISKEFRLLGQDEIPNDSKVVYGVYARIGA